MLFSNSLHQYHRKCQENGGNILKFNMSSACFCAPSTINWKSLFNKTLFLSPCFSVDVVCLGMVDIVTHFNDPVFILFEPKNNSYWCLKHKMVHLVCAK